MRFDTLDEIVGLMQEKKRRDFESIRLHEYLKVISIE